MLDGRLDFIDAQSLDRMANDATAKGFADKVEVVADAAQETGEGEDRTESARVIITLADGTTKSRYVAYVPGFPTHRLGKAEVEAKARELVEPVLGAARCERLIELCDGLDGLETVDPVVQLMRFESGSN